MKLSEHLAISKRAVKMLFRLEKNYTLCLISSSVISALTPYVPVYFSARLIDALHAGAPVKTLALYAALTAGLVFALNLINTWLSSFGEKAGNAMYRAECWLYSEKAMSMAYETTENNETVLLRERLKKESQTGYNLSCLPTCIQSFSSHITKIICSLALMVSFFRIGAIPLFMKLGLLGLLMFTVAAAVIMTAKTQKLTNHYYNDCVWLNVIWAKYDEYFNDYSAGKDIRLYDMGGKLADDMAAVDYQTARKRITLSVKQTALSLPKVFLLHLLKFAAYLVLIMGALAGAVSVGSIAKYVSCIMLLLSAVSSLVTTVQISLANHVYLKGYFSYFDIPNNMYQGTLTVEKRDDAEYYVEFRNVSFKYPGTDTYVLRHINLKFKIGEKLAVVGRNGSGKTTFIKLLCRLYDPTEGEILLNGVNIQKYDYDEYMSIFSVVFQDFRLFAFSLGQNVAASQSYDKKKAAACLEKAGFGECLSSLPKGVETYLYKNYDEDGFEISGGEAQKVALARALYKDAPFIVLDEPTAALDPVAEYEIYSKFNSIVGEKTAIYISHRLASCRFCSNIVVFDNGSIVQHGSHEELLSEKAGKYHELWYAQAQYYTEKA